MLNKNLFKLDLTLFDTASNVTSSNTPGNDLSPEMKTFYSDYLIDNALTNLVHDQFGQKHPIPKNGGKTIEFRKYSPLPKMTTALEEGVTPDGQALNVSIITATVEQYGGWIQLPDMLLLSAIDNNMVQATELLGDQAGRTLDTITREVLNGGTNVQYAPIITGDTVTPVTARSSITADAKFTVDCVYKAVRFLKTQLAKPIEGSYVAIIHPDVAYDLMRSDEWIEAHKYARPENLYNGEIGKIANCRFIETTEAKIFGGAGADGIDVYSTLILGANAYGITEISGGGLEHIIKQLGSSGTADPLNQRASAGWKATKTAERLVEGYMVRIESASSFQSGSN
ncbi:MAG: N4-gp56 family major capsid protein [Oscillospiraceae bacterium]|nr:N4-gp56 family major capsid protein [Oscillospiraceae bacterium]